MQYFHRHSSVSPSLLTATRLDILEMWFPSSEETRNFFQLPPSPGLSWSFPPLTCPPLHFCTAVPTASWASGLPAVLVPSWFQLVCLLFAPQTSFLPLLSVERAFLAGLTHGCPGPFTFQALRLTLTTDLEVFSQVYTYPISMLRAVRERSLNHSSRRRIKSLWPPGTYTNKCPWTTALFYSKLSRGTQPWRPFFRNRT